MKRREFITLLGARRQLAGGGESAAAGEATDLGFLGSRGCDWSQRAAAFVQRLRELGWIEGRKMAIDFAGRRDGANALRDRGRVRPAQSRRHRHVRSAAVLAAMQATSTIPIVFALAGGCAG